MNTSSSDRLQYLLAAYAGKNCTPAEEEELTSLLEDKWKEIDPGRQAPTVDWETMYQQITLAPVVTLGKKKTRRLFYRVAAAAAILFLLATGGYFFFTNKPGKSPEIVKTPEAVKDIMAPQQTKASITLANGQVVYLDSAADGTLAMQGDVNVLKTGDNQLSYSQTSSLPTGREGRGEALYNTLNNPRGSKVVNITLSDGTKVWLNSESSLRYPVAYVGNERKVEITGEAYFEVEYNAAKPFIVQKGNMQVRVLGTHFNVNAYDDEGSITTTLLEGKVKVSSAIGKESAILKPGEQVSLSQSSHLSHPIPVQTDAVIAWKNGEFIFNSLDIKSIMRQIGRWYNVEIKYEGNISKETFSGNVSRNTKASDVLRILEEGGVKFIVERNPATGKAETIIVKQ